MTKTEKALLWGLGLQGKITYSMSQRLAANKMDCSSFLFRSMIQAGIIPPGSAIGNTETIYTMARQGKVLKRISESEVRRGDLFNAGVEGASLGSGGHTGWHLQPLTQGSGKILHCTYGYRANNIAVTNARGWMGDYSGLPVGHFRVIGEGSTGVNENQTQQRVLAIDGSWGPASTRRLQEVLGCAIRDGIISGQTRNRANQNIPSVEFGTGGSNVIRALQKLLNRPQTGNFDEADCRALQQRMGTLQDGEISQVSDCVKAMQRRLNEGKI